MTIFINEIPLILCSAEKAEQFQNDAKTLKGRFLNQKMLHSYIDMMEKPHQFEKVVIWSEDLKTLKPDFKNLFKIIKAAGGVVKNDKGEILFIFRRNSWDLPKGKIDAGEKKKQAAVREVQEETGLQQVELLKKICKTNHVYQQGDRRILKVAYWYNMTTSENELKPQIEEDIEQAVWMSKEAFFSEERVVYQSIKLVLSKIE